MLKPLQDRVLVLMDDSLQNTAGLLIPLKIDKWRAKDGAVEGQNRGQVAAVGPGKRNRDTGVLMPMTVKPGDWVRFSELEYMEHKEGGKRYALIQLADVLVVEEDQE